MATRKALVSLAAGISTGFLLGLLFASQKRVRTNKEIVGKGKDPGEARNETFGKKVDELMSSLTSRIIKGMPLNDT